MPAVRARRATDPTTQNARRATWWRYLLPILAMLYLGVMAYRRSAPVVRVVTSWAQSANPQYWEYGIGAISATVLLWYFAGQAQRPRGWGNATPRGETTRRRPATDGDHGRERESAPGPTRTPTRARSQSPDIPIRNVVDAMVETRGMVLATKEDLLTAIRSLPHQILANISALAPGPPAERPRMAAPAARGPAPVPGLAPLENFHTPAPQAVLS